MSTRTKQILMVVVTAACGAAIEVFGPKGPWSHAFWAPVAVALLTELRTALGLSAQPSVSAHEVAARITGSPPVVPLILALAIVTTSCAHVQPYVGPVVKCAGVDIAPFAGEVADDLATGNFADLDALAFTHGVPFVACVIRAFLAKTNAGPATRNGSEWLKARDVTFAD